MENKQIDLFEHYELIPVNVYRILEKYFEEAEKQPGYEELKKLLKQCEALGYTFDYGLDAVPYNLRKI